MVLTESINGHCGDKEFQEIDGIVEMGGGDPLEIGLIDHVPWKIYYKNLSH